MWELENCSRTESVLVAESATFLQRLNSLLNNKSQSEVHFDHVPEKSEIPKANTEIIIVASISLLLLAVNVRMMCVLREIPSQQAKPSGLLIANLSLVCIGCSITFGLHILEKVGVLRVTGPRLCGIVSFFRNVVYTGYSLNILGIVYVFTDVFRQTLRKSVVVTIVLAIWGFATVSSVPTIFWVQLERRHPSGEKCHRIPLFGSECMTLMYGLFRFVIVHLVEVIYLCFALRRIHLKINFLSINQRPPNNRIRKLRRRLRIVYFYCFAFILVWLPDGIAMFTFSVLGRISKKQLSPPLIIMWASTFLFLLNHTLMCLSPFIFLHSIKDLTKFSWIPSLSLRRLCCFPNRSNRMAMSEIDSSLPMP